MKKYYVYKITNKLNNKVYIGYTSLSIARRFHKHYTNSLYGTKSKLYDSIRKNGISNFSIVELDVFSDQQKAFDSEKFYISKYDSFKYGYNMTLGGDGGDCTLYMTEERFIEYKRKLSLKNSGSKNNTFSGYSDDDIVNFGVQCYLDNNNWIQSHWIKNYCEKYKIPKSYSKFRFNGEGLIGLKSRILKKINDLGYNVSSIKYKITDSHKKNLSDLYKGKRWYHNDTLLLCKQLNENEVDDLWILGMKKYKK